MTASFDSSIFAPQPTSPLVRADKHSYPVRELSKGDMLYYLGDEAEAIFRIEEGLLKQSVDLLNGRERITSIAGPGDLVGAISAVHHAYQDNVEALSPRVLVQAIPREHLGEELKDALHIALSQQLTRLRDALEDSELPVNARLARTLLRLGQRFGQSAENNQVRLTLPLTHENFAAMIGAARETTTAVLSEMRSDGLISGTRGQYSFDSSQLSDFAVSSAC